MSAWPLFSSKISVLIFLSLTYTHTHTHTHMYTHTHTHTHNKSSHHCSHSHTHTHRRFKNALAKCSGQNIRRIPRLFCPAPRKRSCVRNLPGPSVTLMSGAPPHLALESLE